MLREADPETGTLDDLLPATRGVAGRSGTDAPDRRVASDLSGVSLPVAPSDDHPFQSRVGGGQHLHPDETRLCIPVRGPGLGQSPGVGLAVI